MRTKSIPALRKNGNVEMRQRGRKVEVSTASESFQKIMKFGRDQFPVEQKVTPAQAVATGLRKLYPKMAGDIAAALIASTPTEATETAAAE